MLKLIAIFLCKYYDHLIFWWLTNLSQQHNGLFDCVTQTEKMFESFALSTCICNNTFVERVMFTFEIGNSKDSVMQCNKFMGPRKYLKVENSVHRQICLRAELPILAVNIILFWYIQQYLRCMSNRKVFILIQQIIQYLCTTYVH